MCGKAIAILLSIHTLFNIIDVRNKKLVESFDSSSSSGLFARQIRPRA